MRSDGLEYAADASIANVMFPLNPLASTRNENSWYVLVKSQVANISLFIRKRTPAAKAAFASNVTTKISIRIPLFESTTGTVQDVTVVQVLRGSCTITSESFWYRNRLTLVTSGTW